MKKLIKKIIGQDNITKIRHTVKYSRDRIYLCFHERIICENSEILYKKFSQKNKHVFFGYYDIQQFDAEEKNLLVHVVKKHASAFKDKAELGCYNAADGRYTSFAETRAWCWQQGARLRWHPVNKDLILYNDVEKGNYVTRIFNLETKKICRTIPAALYDMDPTASYGLSINFSRLQRLRPGYGYSTLPDKTEALSAPADDGIFYVDLKNNTKKLIISLEKLADEISDPAADQHYINHISISPDGSKFMFFHIWTLKGDSHWGTRLCVYNLKEEKTDVLERKDRVSHYSWKNNNELLITCWGKDKKQYYCIYNLSTGRKTLIQNNGLRNDGHPTVLNNERTFISDTYPLAHDMQTVFEYSMDKDKLRTIITLYSDAKLFEEKRCDLHPRVSLSEKYITLDTTCENGCRQIILLKDWEGKEYA